MTNTPLTEDELIIRLKSAGKNDDEINEIISKYIQAASQTYPNNDAMNALLLKSQESAILRVRGFGLTREQYDVLNNYFKSPNLDSNDIDASTLVQKVLDEFIKVIQ